MKCGNVAKEIPSYAKVMDASMILLNKADIEDKSDNIWKVYKGNPSQFGNSSSYFEE